MCGFCVWCEDALERQARAPAVPVRWRGFACVRVRVRRDTEALEF